MTDYLVVYTTKNEFYQNNNDTTDHYEAFLEDKEEAEKRYKEVLKMDNLWSASLCVPIQSDQYETSTDYNGAKLMAMNYIDKVEKLEEFGMLPDTLIIEVEGGCLRAVHNDSNGYIVFDWDNIKEEGKLEEKEKELANILKLLEGL